MEHPRSIYHNIRLIAIAALCLWAIACTTPGDDENSPGSGKDSTSTAAVEKPRAFPMPLIPADITSQEASMQYALHNFWNRYDFSDTTAHNIAIGENGFRTFLALLRNADTATVDSAMAGFLAMGCRHDESYSRCDALVRRHLDNPESPMRNDGLYTVYLRRRLLTTTDEALQGRIRFRIKLLEKNRPGTIATDFAYIDRAGKSGRMHSLHTPLLLLIFADPDCESCKAILPRMMGDRLLQDKRVKVMIVYPGDDTEMWNSCTARIPLGWIDARSPDGEIADKLLYHIPAMPSLYLLDADKRVILKDASHEDVCSEIAKRLREMK